MHKRAPVTRILGRTTRLAFNKSLPLLVELAFHDLEKKFKGIVILKMSFPCYLEGSLAFSSREGEGPTISKMTPPTLSVSIYAKPPLESCIV